ncbi:MAG: TraB/GumN family protein [Comamonadaceae bacterium]|nr:TraB/GumN family protein [Comamonadaceae bacterium]
MLLLGTIHVGQAGMTELTDAQSRRVRAAEVIVVEADVSDAQRTMAAFQRHALLAADAPGLDRTLPPALRARVEKLLPRFGLAPEAVWRMKPWVVANNLVVMEAMRAGLQPRAVDRGPAVRAGARCRPAGGRDRERGPAAGAVRLGARGPCSSPTSRRR